LNCGSKSVCRRAQEYVTYFFQNKYRILGDDRYRRGIGTFTNSEGGSVRQTEKTTIATSIDATLADFKEFAKAELARTFGFGQYAPAMLRVA